jgi:hypothetical protein
MRVGIQYSNLLYKGKYLEKEDMKEEENHDFII